MGNKKIVELTADEEKELEELRKSPYVKLAKREQNLIYKRKQYLYGLRNLEKRGKELAENGVTAEKLAQHIAEVDE